MLIADVREPEGMRKDCDTVYDLKKMLGVGDFLIVVTKEDGTEQRLIVERKTAADFINTTVYGRTLEYAARWRGCSHLREDVCPAEAGRMVDEAPHNAERRGAPHARVLHIIQQADHPAATYLRGKDEEGRVGSYAPTDSHSSCHQE